ncbi:MAG TPA: response regulator receiver protein [Desulfobacteraceae bacterium]|nr:response regulator receiver protein [Desulfobacteraceae bacterium]
MKTILVVDDEKMILRLATEALESHGEGFNVITALNGKQATQLLSSSKVELVLTDLKMPVMDGYELLSYMSKNYRDIPVIVMTGFGSPEIAKRLRQKGILYYIEKPFEISALREKVSDVFTAKSKGYIHGFTLANFLQTVEVEQKTTTLRVSAKGRVGYLHLENGDLMDAEAGNLRGERAAIEILCWDNAEIEIQTLQNRKKTIESSMMHILLEASKIKDEKGAGITSSQDEPLEDAIRLAEGHHFKKAQEIIAKYLKSNPRTYLGWLWYSRIIVTMKSIEASLSNAGKLAPTDPEVIEEIRKFRLAKQNLPPDAQIRRCPFCWCPMEIRTVQCPYCKTHLFIHSRFFKSLGAANRKILEASVERYMKVIGGEKNINAHYFLGIAHLNLENWEEALNLFHKTVKLAPDKKIFSEQLRLLLNHMAMDSTTVAFEKQVADKEQEQEKTEEEQSEKQVKPADNKPVKKKVLVVEDSSTTRKVIAITLAQKGYEIIEAKDGLEALSRLNEEKPDLVLLDIILPKMDGYKILSIIKGNAVFKDIPVIMLTSRDSFMHKVKGRLAGSTAYLTKPFDPKVLVDTIEKHI